MPEKFTENSGIHSPQNLKSFLISQGLSEIEG